MATFTVSGKIVKRRRTSVGFGNPLGLFRKPSKLEEAIRDLRLQFEGAVPVAFQAPLDVRLFLRFIPVDGPIAEHVLVARTDDVGSFSATFEAEEDDLMPGFLLRTRYEAYLPEGFCDPVAEEQILTTINVPGDVPGGSNRERLFNWFRRELSTIEIPVTTDGLRSLDLTVTLPPDGGTGAFPNSAPVIVEFFDSSNNQLGLAPLWGDDETRIARVLLFEGFQGMNVWWRVRTSTELVLEDTPATDVCLMRSALRVPDGSTFPTQAAALRVDQSIGVGTMGAQVPEEGVVPGTPCVFRGIDLDFVEVGPFGFLLRVRTLVGLGWEEDDGSVFLLSSLGTFTGHYQLEVQNLSDSEFDFNELDSVVTINRMGKVFDAFPGTDIDEAVTGGPDALENAIAGVIDDNVLPILQANIGEAIHQPLEDMEDDLAERLPDFPLAVSNMILSEFVQINSFETTVDGIDVVARGGMWSGELSLLDADFNCPFAVMAMAAPGVRSMASGRAYQKTMKDHSLAPWSQLFEAHRKEIAKVLREDPKLALEAARVARDLHPNRLSAKDGLDKKLASRLSSVAEKIAKKGSKDLKEVATLVAKVAKDATDDGLVKAASRLHGKAGNNAPAKKAAPKRKTTKKS